MSNNSKYSKTHNSLLFRKRQKTTEREENLRKRENEKKNKKKERILMLIHSKLQMNEPKMRAVRQCRKRRKERILSRAQDKNFYSITKLYNTEHHPVGHEHGYEHGSAGMYSTSTPHLHFYREVCTFITLHRKNKSKCRPCISYTIKYRVMYNASGASHMHIL